MKKVDNQAHEPPQIDEPTENKKVKKYIKRYLGGEKNEGWLAKKIQKKRSDEKKDE